jgi:SprT protein
MTELQAKAIKRIYAVYEKAESIYGVSFKLPDISFKLKGRRAGYVIPAYNKLALNNELLHTYGDEFINDTPGHEAAHLIAYQAYGYMIEPHGKEWKKVMTTVCEQDPTRCHNFEVKTRNEYICKCSKSIYLSTTKHNRVLRGDDRYYCKTCNAEIKWKKLYEKAAFNSPVVQVSPQISATIYR